MQAEIVELNGSMELAPGLGLSRLIVDLVQTGSTLKANGLVETECIAHVSSRLIVNRVALKTRPEEIAGWIERFRRALAGMMPRPLHRATRCSARFSAPAVPGARPRPRSRMRSQTSSPRVRATVTRRSSTTPTRFDRVNYGLVDLRVTPAEMPRPRAATPPALRDALGPGRRAHRSLPSGAAARKTSLTRDAAGAELGMRWGALDAVGIYVPGGKASYPSSVLMNAMPARVAGRLAHRHVRAGARRRAQSAGAGRGRAGRGDEIYRIGGAQAVAALAYGTETIAAVDSIVGPGNAYVAEAKRQVFGRVGIDGIAGPSEVLVVADAANEPGRVAAGSAGPGRA